MNIILIVIAAILAAFAQLMLKKAAVTSVLPKDEIIVYFFNLIKNIYAWLGACSYGTSFIFYMIALKNIKLSYARAFSSASYILVIILSIVLYKEQVNFVTLLGMIVIGVGILLVGLGYH